MRWTLFSDANGVHSRQVPLYFKFLLSLNVNRQPVVCATISFVTDTLTVKTDPTNSRRIVSTSIALQHNSNAPITRIVYLKHGIVIKNRIALMDPMKKIVKRRKNVIHWMISLANQVEFLEELLSDCFLWAYRVMRKLECLLSIRHKGLEINEKILFFFCY